MADDESIYATRFEGDLVGELRAWLHIAARREATITEVHRDLLRRPELANPTSPAMEVALEVFTLIAKHEARHREFIESVLTGELFRARTFAADLMIWLGAVEATVLGPLTSQATAQRALGGLLSLCSALEERSRACYVQLERLARALWQAGDHRTALDDLARESSLRVLEEQVHERAFREMATWASPAEGALEISRRAYVQRLAPLLPRSAGAGEARHARVLTHAGLAELFEHDNLT